jgi:hypothetical protein
MGDNPESIGELLHLAKPGILSCCTSAIVHSNVVEHVDEEFQDRWNGTNLAYKRERLVVAGVTSSRSLRLRINSAEPFRNKPA